MEDKCKTYGSDAIICSSLSFVHDTPNNTNKTLFSHIKAKIQFLCKLANKRYSRQGNVLKRNHNSGSTIQKLTVELYSFIHWSVED